MTGNRRAAWLPSLDTLDARIMPATAHHAVVAHAVHAVAVHVARPATIQLAAKSAVTPAATVSTPAAASTATATAHAAVVTPQVTLPSPSTGTAPDGETFTIKSATSSAAVPVSFSPQEYPTVTLSDGEKLTVR